MTHNPNTSTGAAVSTQPAAPVEHQLTDQSKSKGPAMTPHVDQMDAPELVAADVAILAVAAAVANAAQHLAAARTAILEMEVALAEYNSRDGRSVCGCS